MTTRIPRRVASALARAPGFLRALLAVSRPERFLVLCYHRVNDKRHPFFGGVPTRLFKDQMQVLKEHFHVLPLDELVECVSAGSAPKNAVAITFDDGYRDNYTEAFPVLRELALPATIYVVTGAIDEGALIWHDRVFDAFHRTQEQSLTVDGQSMPLLGDEAKRRALARVLAGLRACAPAERDARIDSLLTSLGVSSNGTDDWSKLSWSDAREMSRHGIRFGAHTVDHPILSRVDPNEARRQIRESKARIEAELKEPVTSFAYPNGSPADFDETTKSLLSQEGYRSAVTTIGGANDESCDALALRRVGMWGPDPYLSALRLARARLA